MRIKEVISKEEDKGCLCGEDRVIEFFSEEELKEFSKILKAVSNPIRLQIIKILMNSPQCVCVLSAITKKDQTLISHHLSKMRELGIVKEHEIGRFRIYSLEDERIKRIVTSLYESGRSLLS